MSLVEPRPVVLVGECHRLAGSVELENAIGAGLVGAGLLARHGCDEFVFLVPRGDRLACRDSDTRLVPLVMRERLP